MKEITPGRVQNTFLHKFTYLNNSNLKKFKFENNNQDTYLYKRSKNYF